MGFDKEDYRGGYVLGTVLLGLVTVWSFFTKLEVFEEASILALFATLAVLQLSVILAYHSFEIILKLMT